MNVFDLQAKIGINTTEYKKGLSEASREFSEFGGKVKDGAAKLAKISTAALGAAAAGVTALVKQSVSAYAEYEQLVGGIETLFGNSARKVLENANKAFATAGMSANEYMETSIQGAAALINSLGGDTEKAAELMDISIQDMSDNVNKMGTTMESVQNAYRGFSRGNFTMLDNLALGFAGTKEGMEQLLEKAKEFSGVEYDISSYADIVEAIHVVQTQMGITGTTAKEAAGTITGSMASVKASWKNLTVELAKGDGNINAAFQVLGDNVGSMIENMLPRVEEALGGVGTLITEASPQITSAISKLLPKVLPSLLRTAVSLVSSVGTAAISAVPDLLDTGRNLLANLAYSLENADFDGFSVFTNVFDSVFSNLPYYAQYAEMIISNLANKILDVDYGQLATNIGTLITTGINSITNLIDDIDWEKVGKDAADFVNNIPWGDIADQAIECFETAIKNIPELAKGFFDNIDGDNLMDGIAVLASIKFLKSMKAAFSSNSECQTEWTGIGSVMKTKLSDVGTENGVSYARAFMLSAEAAIVGWKIGEKIRETEEEKYGKENTYDVYGKIGWNTVSPVAGAYIGIKEGIDKIKDYIDKDKTFTYMGKDGKEHQAYVFDKNGNFSAAYSKAGEQHNIKGVFDDYGAIPKYGNGGRVTRPTLAFIGEKEPETIVPDSKRGQLGNVTYNVTFNVDGYSIKDDASFIEQMSRKLEELRIKQSRAMGGAAW